jgi:hypothetical protein
MKRLYATMTTLTLHDRILKALSGSSSQTPVNLLKLQTMFVTDIEPDALTRELDSMCASHELQVCYGIKGGESYTSYWLSGVIPPSWKMSHKASAAIARKSAKGKTD